VIQIPKNQQIIRRIIKPPDRTPLALRLGNALADSGPGSRQTLVEIIETTTPGELAKVWPELSPQNCDRLWTIWRDRRAETCRTH
jgi:hypothetical protein